MSDWAHEPRNVIERACDRALDALAEELATEGAEVKRAFVLVLADGLPDGRDACTAGTGVEDAAELIAFVTSHLIQAGQKAGLKIVVAPLSGGPLS